MVDYSKNPMTGTTVTARVTRWWRVQTSAPQRKKFLQGTLGVACFGAFVAAMPMIAGANAVQQSEEQFRDRSVQLAEIREDEVEITSALTHKSQLLSHDWLRFVEYSLVRDPSSALSPYSAFDRDKAAINSLVTLDVPKRTDAEDMLRQKQCLATAIYYEARSESIKGQLGVAEVIINRVNDHRYPNTICDVVFQGATRTTGCQFTFTCDGAMNKKPRGEKWTKANTIAAHVLMDLNERKTAGATHYHATYVDPVWNSGLIRTKKIGTHIFYRFPRGSEWSVASARQSARLAQRRAGLKAITPADSAVEAETKLLKPAKAETVADLNAQALESIKTEASVQSTTATEAGARAEPAPNVADDTPITTASNETTPPSSVNSAF
ncbi:MAG: cell wall hydrolase [Hyphomonadaceae bacterium]|nr:cell wall hydrolase [Hyphomonadaceae bacterium]